MCLKRCEEWCDEMQLNIRQQKFASFYAETGNGTQSAIDAGYSAKTAYSIATRLLKKVEIQKMIQNIVNEQSKSKILNAQDRRVILSNIAKDEMEDAANRIRAIDTLNRMTAEYKRAESKLEQDTNQSVELPQLLKALQEDSQK